MATAPIAFNVRRSDPELVVPAKLTPSHVLNLSDLDCEESLRSFVPFLQIYNSNPSMENRDPVQVMKNALAQTLVFYYPVAGRLRECADDRRKLEVDCTAEGVLFIEADADVSVKELGYPLYLPFPFLDKFLIDLGSGEEVLNCPLLQVQVTRLTCGGFVLAMQMNHNMFDGGGIIEFLNTMSEIARGAVSPSIPPVWQRDLICARNPPKVTFVHHEFDDNVNSEIIPNMSYRLLFFTKKQIAALRKLVPDHLQTTASSFDLMTACIWRTRALALQLDPEQKAGLSFALDARQRFSPPLPKGYYGNAVACAGVMATAKELRENPLAHAVEKVRAAKEKVTDEYMRSYVDELVIRGYPVVGGTMPAFFVSDMRRIEFYAVNYGWGKPVYGGPAYAWYDPYPHMTSSFNLCKSGDGEDVTMVAVCLPEPNMELFMKELRQLIDIEGIDPFANRNGVLEH